MVGNKQKPTTNFSYLLIQVAVVYNKTHTSTFQIVILDFEVHIRLELDGESLVYCTLSCDCECNGMCGDVTERDSFHLTLLFAD